VPLLSFSFLFSSTSSFLERIFWWQEWWDSEKIQGSDVGGVENYKKKKKLFLVTNFLYNDFFSSPLQIRYIGVPLYIAICSRWNKTNKSILGISLQIGGTVNFHTILPQIHNLGFCFVNFTTRFHQVEFFGLELDF
jgi:hypothetical protein